MWTGDQHGDREYDDLQKLQASVKAALICFTMWVWCYSPWYSQKNKMCYFWKVRNHCVVNSALPLWIKRHSLKCFMPNRLIRICILKMVQNIVSLKVASKNHICEPRPESREGCKVTVVKFSKEMEKCWKPLHELLFFFFAFQKRNVHKFFCHCEKYYMNQSL